MPTSARWEVANPPKISVELVQSAGGQSRPPLQGVRRGVVGADDSVGPINVTNLPKISVKRYNPRGPMRCPQASFEAQPRFARLLASKMGIGPYRTPRPRLPLGSRGAGPKGLRGFECCKFRRTLNLETNPLRHFLRKCHLPLPCGAWQGEALVCTALILPSSPAASGRRWRR